MQYVTSAGIDRATDSCNMYAALQYWCGTIMFGSRGYGITTYVVKS